MAKAQRTLHANHKHLTEYLKNHFKGRGMPGAVSVSNIIETVVNSVEIFAACGIATATDMPRHCIVVSYNGISDITICDTEVFTGRWSKSPSSAETGKFLDNLIKAYIPESPDETPLTTKFYHNINTYSHIPLNKTFVADHKHLTDYLYNSIRYAPEILPVGEEFYTEKNGVKISACFFSFDINKSPMDYMVITNEKCSTVYFLSRFEPVKYSVESFSIKGPKHFGTAPDNIDPVNMNNAYTRAVVYLNRYNPAAPDEKNNYNIK